MGAYENGFNPTGADAALVRPLLGLSIMSRLGVVIGVAQPDALTAAIDRDKHDPSVLERATQRGQCGGARLSGSRLKVEDGAQADARSLGQVPLRDPQQAPRSTTLPGCDGRIIS